MLYPMTEIFYSLQGEGRNTGMPAWFIRLAGCNLRCKWCDTNYSINNRLGEKNILQMVGDEEGFGCKNVIITGGEPSIHNLRPLLKLLKKNHYWVAIETNGTKNLLPYKCLGLLSWVTVSPKVLPIKTNCIIDEIKLVWPSELDREKVLQIPARHYYLQPMDVGRLEENGRNVELTIQQVKENPLWSLSLQTHKILNLR